MKRRTRKILFYLILLFFITGTPLVLGYAMGYSFDWQEKKPVLTGAFYIRSTPKEAKVYINDQETAKTPSFIRRLAPRDYQIKVEKEGYYPWNKKLKIKSKIVTEANNIFFIPKEINIEIIQSNLEKNFSLNEYIPQEESEEIFYIQKESYILYKTDKENTFNKQISLTSLPKNQNYQVSTSVNQKIAALSDDGYLYLLNPKTKMFEIIGQNIIGFQFSGDNQKLLYFSPSEIWVHYLENISRQPSKKAGEQELITRLSQKIKQAIWFERTNEHIIFLVGQTLKFAELDGRDFRNIVDITELNIEEIAYHPREEKVYLANRDKLLAISL